MNTLRGVILSLKSGNYNIINTMPIKDFNLSLGAKETEWELGLDPATKFTGIALRDTASHFVILLDCIYDNRVPPEQYFEDQFYLLKRLAKGHTFKRVVLERPFNSPYRHTNHVLMALRGRVETWISSIPELNTAQREQIYPNSWKSRVIDKKKGKNRYNQKGAVAEDLCDIYPGLREYFCSCTSGDYDSFDALGILVGYERYSHTADGNEQICGDKGRQHVSFVGYRWEKNEDLEDDNYLQSVFGKALEFLRPVFLDYNESYSFVDNVAMATNNNDAVASIVPEKQLQQFQWKLGIDVTEPNHTLMMFAFRKGHYTLGTFQVIQQLFPLNEEIGG